jgi:shikimate dehydrogenase
VRELFLLAWPAGHSISPGMQNAALQATGFPARYSAWEVAPAGLPAAITRLRDASVLGANVTIPHKQAVIPLLDELTPAAAAIGAVNTISNSAGRLTGHNTDGSGFLAALAEADFMPQGKRVVMLGAGGAARAVLHALLGSGVERVLLSNRTQATAERLASDFAALGQVAVLGGAELPQAVVACDLLINTTSVGMAAGGEASPQVSPLPAALLPASGLVVDLIYRPPVTLLLQRARAAGLRVQNGLPMLVWQGAQAFTIWTGQAAPTLVMRRAAESLLAGDAFEQLQ